ncbi:hypothetical protein CAEBREN_03277 [Caenorhabditis brenneri]|uniref:Uncharacterized protein n=1 Tax=Caenorhabditis brenneri TaxID=135651 RepID=G0N471_CAEBE|nr:hypothetical protein CAEBREN_03277 [Caenorhabditis brenneri]
MRRLIFCLMLLAVTSSGKPTKKKPCKWFINKVTPGPFGTELYKKSGSRREREYIELQCIGGNPTYTHLNVIVVQSLVTAGFSKSFPTPMPTILANYRFDGLRNKDKIITSEDGRTHSIFIGRTYSNPDDDLYFMPSYSIRKKCATSIYLNVLTTPSMKFLSSNLKKSFDVDRVFYSIHVMDGNWNEVNKFDKKYINSLFSYPERETSRTEEVRRIDGMLAEIIRKYQIDSILFAPKYAGWDINDPYNRMFVSSYTLAMFENLGVTDGQNREPRLMWYDPTNENPLILCEMSEKTTSSYRFQQVAAQPTDDNADKCIGIMLPFTKLVESEIPVEVEENSGQENEATESCEGDADDLEIVETCPKKIMTSFGSGVRNLNVWENNQCSEIMAVVESLCDDVERQHQGPVCHSEEKPRPAWQGLTGPSVTNPVALYKEDMQQIENGDELYERVIDILMALIIFDNAETPVSATYYESYEVQWRMFCPEKNVQSAKTWDTSRTQLVFHLSPQQYMIGMLNHFSAVHCNRTIKLCTVYDSLQSYREKYDRQYLDLITDAVEFWDASDDDWRAELAPSDLVADQDDGTSCGLFAVYHMSKVLGFKMLEDDVKVTGKNLRLAAMTYIEKKVAEGLLKISTTDGTVYVFPVHKEIKTYIPSEVVIRDVYSSVQPITMFDTPEMEEVLANSYIQSDKLGKPLGRRTWEEQASLKQSTMDMYCKRTKYDMEQNVEGDGGIEGVDAFTGEQALLHIDKDHNNQMDMKINELHSMLQKLLDVVLLVPGGDQAAINSAWRVAAEEAQNIGLARSLKELETKFGFKTDINTLLKYSDFLDVHIGSTVESSYFYCRLCSIGDHSVRDVLPLENYDDSKDQDVVVARKKRAPVRNCKKPFPAFVSTVQAQKPKQCHRLKGKLESRIYLSALITGSKHGTSLVKCPQRWKAFLSHLLRHRKTPSHCAAVELSALERKDKKRREEISESQLQKTFTHFRTVIFMAKMNIPMENFPAMLKVQSANGANVGINLYSAKKGREILQSVSEKLRINLLLAILTSNKPFSMMADSSTSKDSHQYMVLSLRCTLDSYQYDTYFYTIVELKRETTEWVYSIIQQQVKFDSELLHKEGFTKSNEFENWFWRNMIGFASDGGSVFAGTDNGLQGQLTARMSAANQPFFYSICMAHRIDLAFKDISTPFRSFITFLYRVTFRYFGSIQNKLMVETYRNTALAAGVNAPAIKTIFKVRWVASELVALDNLLRGWKWILKHLQFRRSLPVGSKKDIPKARLLETLRFIMEDPRVIRAAVTWKIVLEKITAASKKAQLEAASISSVWPLLYTLEQDMQRNSAWKNREDQLLKEYGLLYSTSYGYKPVDSNVPYFLKDALPFSMRFNSDLSLENRPKISLSKRLEARKFAEQLTVTIPTAKKDIEDLLTETAVVDIRSTAEYDEALENLYLYLTDDLVVMPPKKNAKSDSQNAAKPKLPDSQDTTKTPDPKIRTSARLRAMKYTQAKSASQALDESENPEKFDTITKYPALLQYYASVEWENFKEDVLPAAAKKAVKERREGDEKDLNFNYLQFEALNDRFILEVIQQGVSNIYEHKKWRPQPVYDNWFGSNAEKRKTAVENSLQSYIETFKLDQDFLLQYDEFLERLYVCLSSDETEKIIAQPELFWSIILRNSKCILPGDDILRKAIHSMLALPGSTAHVERAFSIVFHSRGPRKSRMNIDSLAAQMTIRLNVANVEKMDISEFVRYWSMHSSSLAHSNPFYTSSDLYKFKLSINNEKHVDMDEIEELMSPNEPHDQDREVYEMHDEFVPPFDRSTASRKELSIVSDKFLSQSVQPLRQKPK